VKNTDTARLTDYGAGKKISGIKRHIAVDTQGLPHAVAVTTTEVTDRKGALLALARCHGVQAAVQRGSGQLRNIRWLGTPAIIKRQQGVKPKSNNRRFLFSCVIHRHLFNF